MGSVGLPYNPKSLNQAPNRKPDVKSNEFLRTLYLYHLIHSLQRNFETILHHYAKLEITNGCE